MSQHSNKVAEVEKAEAAEDTKEEVEVKQSKGHYMTGMHALISMNIRKIDADFKTVAAMKKHIAKRGGEVPSGTAREPCIEAIKDLPPDYDKTLQRIIVENCDCR